jgi:hypothetical protein
LLTREPADHRIVQSLRKVVWHIHYYPKGLDAAEIPREMECYLRPRLPTKETTGLRTKRTVGKSAPW